MHDLINNENSLERLEFKLNELKAIDESAFNGAYDNSFSSLVKDTSNKLEELREMVSYKYPPEITYKRRNEIEIYMKVLIRVKDSGHELNAQESEILNAYERLNSEYLKGTYRPEQFLINFLNVPDYHHKTIEEDGKLDLSFFQNLKELFIKSKEIEDYLINIAPDKIKYFPKLEELSLEEEKYWIFGQTQTVNILILDILGG